MKRNLSVFLIICMFSFVAPVFAEKEQTVEPPKWEDYVPDKYYEPRYDFSRGGAVTELVFGIILTDLIFTAPFGIPMIIHSSTKLKNVSYAEKKIKFDEGLQEAKLISDPVEKQKYYKNLLRRCKLKESKKIKLERKRAKQAIKEAKKAEKEAKKLEQVKKEIEKIKIDET